MPIYVKGDLVKNLSTMAFHEKLLADGWKVQEEQKPEIKEKKSELKSKKKKADKE